jgi:hypothetical protein
MAVGSGGCRAALASRRLTPEPISSSSGTARLPPSISSLTRFLELEITAATLLAPRAAGGFDVTSQTTSFTDFMIQFLNTQFSNSQVSIRHCERQRSNP